MMVQYKLYDEEQKWKFMYKQEQKHNKDEQEEHQSEDRNQKEEKDKTQLDLFQKMAREGNKRLKIKMKHLKSQNAIYLNPENLNSMSRNSMSLTNNAQSKTQPLNPTSLPTFTQSQLLDPNLSLPVTQTPTENTKNYIQYNSFFAKYKNAGHITKLDSNLKSRSANFQPSPERVLKDQVISRSRNFGVGSKDQGVLENRGFEGNFKKKEIRKPPLGKLVSTKPKIFRGGLRVGEE